MDEEDYAKKTAMEFHKILLEALRQREQDVIRYVALLAPALGGYIWLIQNEVCPNDVDSIVFQYGSIGVILILLIGAIYTITLGYNYRYITLQLAKLESKLGMGEFILNSWPRKSEDFSKNYGLWLGPPEIIKTFYFSFLISIALVCVSFPKYQSDYCWVVVIGILSILFGLALPFFYGYKLRSITIEEKDW